MVEPQNRISEAEFLEIRRRASPACYAVRAAVPTPIACLQPIYDRFTEGFGTADLIAAKQLLDEAVDTGRS
jgi:hypothetical protein